MELPVPLRRLAYRAAHRCLRAVWLIRRPSIRGVKCLLIHEGRILLVRHTYGSRAWDLPGGGVKRREQPLTAARREMREELGVQSANWTELGELRGSIYHRPETVSCFGARLTSPVIAMDAGELAAARWFHPDALPPDLSRYVRPIVSEATISSSG